MSDRCLTSGKVRYKTRKSAAALPSVIGVYYCVACEGWHRTSQASPVNVANAEAARELVLDGPRVPRGSHGTKLADVWPS